MVILGTLSLALFLQCRKGSLTSKQHGCVVWSTALLLIQWKMHARAHACVLLWRYDTMVKVHNVCVSVVVGLILTEVSDLFRVKERPQACRTVDGGQNFGLIRCIRTLSALKMCRWATFPGTCRYRTSVSDLNPASHTQREARLILWTITRLALQREWCIHCLAEEIQCIISLLLHLRLSISPWRPLPTSQRYAFSEPWAY